MIKSFVMLMLSVSLMLFSVGCGEGKEEQKQKTAPVKIELPKGKVRISSNIDDATVYVNGKKKAMIGEGFTNLLLAEGEYKIEVKKPISEDYFYYSIKKIFVGSDTSAKIKMSLKKIATQKREAKLAAKLANYAHVDKYIIHDKNTNLMWQDSIDTKTKELKWDDAKGYCSKLKVGEYDDWRLPSYDELKTLIDYESYDPAIVKSFKYTKSSYYWSLTPYTSASSRAWRIYFKSGYSNYDYKSNSYYVRCVRGRQ